MSAVAERHLMSVQPTEAVREQLDRHVVLPCAVHEEQDANPVPRQSEGTTPTPITETDDIKAAGAVSPREERDGHVGESDVGKAKPHSDVKKGWQQGDGHTESLTPVSITESDDAKFAGAVPDCDEQDSHAGKPGFEAPHSRFDVLTSWSRYTLARCRYKLTDPQVWWRHPVARILATLCVLFLDMYIYVEDPVNDSHILYTSFAMGPVLGLLTFWAAPTPGLAVLRLTISLAAFALACYVGSRLIAKWLLREKLKMVAFASDAGSLCIVLLTASAFWHICARLYCVAVGEGTDQVNNTSNEIFLLFRPSLDFRHVNQCWQVCSLFADMVSILTITDACLQDVRFYPNWVPRLKHVWCQSLKGWVRVLSVWLVLIASTVISIWGIFNTSKEENGAFVSQVWFGGTDEGSRSIVAGFLIFFDLVVCMQDWDFPAFHEPLHLEAKTKVLGLFTTEITFPWITRVLSLIPQPSCRLWTRIRPHLPSADVFTLHIDGKWLQYGPLVIIMFIDIYYTYIQWSYAPEWFGQYQDPRDQFIWGITDDATLEAAYDSGVLKNASLVSFAARRNITSGDPLLAAAETDVKLNSRYVGGLSSTHLGPLIGCLSVAGFAAALWFAEWHVRREIRKSQQRAEEAH
eukprot:TRINITY_DN33997_c0_g1_i1.p1 TRINITY_DN33997_c0_g1~~TRINITY_DN33997_c0_g1_i1.p1  ORF type:complete len:633 (-),score=78.69 TRINITY_DN33997_c0_g1_i1:5-1903(-)